MGNGSSVLTQLTNVPRDLFSSWLGYMLSVEENIESLRAEMRTLISKRDDINRRVATAELRGLQRLNVVQDWLTSVEECRKEAFRIDEEFEKRFRCLGNCSPNLYIQYRLSKNAKNLLDVVKRLHQNVGNFSEVADEIPVRARELPNTSDVVGLDRELQQLLSFVMTKEGGVLGVWGMGGVGKTTLLKTFNNQLQPGLLDSTNNEPGIDIVMLLEVSEKPNIEKIQRDIMRMLKLPWQEEDDVPARANRILQVLIKKKTVIMLDDVWEPLDLQLVGVPAPNSSNARKLIVATRVEDVCARMEARETLKMDCLHGEAAWKLFVEKAKAGRLVSSSSRIENFAKEIVEKCGGLPLALNKIGLAMATKRSWEEWMYDLRVLKSTPEEFHGMVDYIFNCLKRSYDELPSDLLRTCFLYFCLYPEAFEVNSYCIMNYWIGEGLISDFSAFDDGFGQVQSIIGRLKTANLLEGNEGDAYHVKMHRMIRSMALWIASDRGNDRSKWLVQSGAGLNTAPELEKWRAAERISLMYNDMSSLHSGVYECPRLVSLMLGGNGRLSSLPMDFFQLMPSLRVLDLSETGLEQLPAEIGKLVALQHLDLRKTRITSVPRELGNLTKLRYLDLSETPRLETIPDGVIAGLQAEVQLLRMWKSYGVWEVRPEAAGAAVFEELETLRRLNFLEITVTTTSAMRWLSGNPRLAPVTWSLHARALGEATTLDLRSSLGGAMWKLYRLLVSDSDELEVVVVHDDAWRTSHPNLINLYFQRLERAKIVWNVVLSPGCPQNLLELEICLCPRIEQLMGEVAEEAERKMVAFPKLEQLRLIQLPEMQIICRSQLTLPSLRILTVDRCPKLKRLPFGGHSVKKLEVIMGQREWWEGLEWEDDDTAASFRHRFREL